MSRRSFAGMTAVALVTLLLMTALIPSVAVGRDNARGKARISVQDAASPRPDIVVVLLDDIPKLDGRMLKRLPNIRRVFLDKGVEFTDFHGETPTCCPGRAGFLTGLHTHHHGAIKTDGRLFDPGMTVATQLRKSGYHTIQVGKYLNLFDLIPDKWPPGWSRFSGFSGAYYDYSMWTNGVRRHYGSSARDYSTDVISGLALSALKAAPRNKRIFAWITPYTFHLPRQVAPRHKRSKKCSGLARWAPPGYMERDVSDKPAYIRKHKVRQKSGFDLVRVCRGMLSVDQMVGKIVNRLKKQGRWENTLFILTSDNGMTYGSHRILDDKKTPYATQVPFFVRWPRVLGGKKRKVDERVQNIDLAPTICDIAGCHLGPYPTGQKRPDGRSFLKLLMGQKVRLPRDAVLSSYRHAGKWIPRWWSVTTTHRSDLADRKCQSRKSGGCRWLYVEYETGARELYDVSGGPCWRWNRRKAGDPCLLHNLAGKKSHRAIQSALRHRLRQLR